MEKQNFDDKIGFRSYLPVARTDVIEKGINGFKVL
jgi:hypothetical protein